MHACYIYAYARGAHMCVCVLTTLCVCVVFFFWKAAKKFVAGFLLDGQKEKKIKITSLQEQGHAQHHFDP